MKSHWIVILILLVSFTSFSQDIPVELTEQEKRDSTYIHEIERVKAPAKVLHAEPLYIDLIRDLGARKGEKEWNVGVGMTDKLSHDEYSALVEYEWAVIDRLGLEVEVPLTFYSRSHRNGNGEPKPANRIESLKLAAQWTFLVSEKHNTSLALGFINEFEFFDLQKLNFDNMIEGNLFNPFFIAAKRWGNNFHTLLYTGPQFHYNYESKSSHTAYEINTNFHYMIRGTRNFIGVELNKVVDRGKLDMVIRPQMRVMINDGLMIGIVPGIPVSKDRERLSSFLRIIYEPGHRHH